MNTGQPLWNAIKCGSWLACEDGGPGETSVTCPTAFVASLKLDNSHRGLGFQVVAGVHRSKCGSWLACEDGGPGETSVA